MKKVKKQRGKENLRRIKRNIVLGIFAFLPFRFSALLLFRLFALLPLCLLCSLSLLCFPLSFHQ